MSLERIEKLIQMEICGLEIDQAHQETLNFNNTDLTIADRAEVPVFSMVFFSKRQN